MTIFAGAVYFGTNKALAEEIKKRQAEPLTVQNHLALAYLYAVVENRMTALGNNVRSVPNALDSFPKQD